MSTERTILDEDSDLGTTVRDLARDAHRLLAGGRVPSPREVSALLARVSQVGGQVRGRRDGELRRWLDNLRRRLESASRQEALATTVTA